MAGLLGAAATCCRAQHYAYAFDGTTYNLITRVDGTIPYVEIGGKEVARPRDTLAMLKAPAYRPGFVTMDHFKRALEATVFADDPSETGELHDEKASLTANFTADVDIAAPFILVDFHLANGRRGCLIAPLPDLRAGVKTQARLRFPVNADLRHSSYDLHIFTRHGEYRHTPVKVASQ